ncbi:LysM peptidoglycan-binding domain-containing protein [Planococcus sp. CPCC 101016]|uniref:C40 family peptidase n=1 Tax=Planococcus sp. CPCC 101016 TaxID=2599617 RepID=UPI0011B3D52C|nr:LysM peptidoglycan-binding domain-containing protein [Planococcus sp. CPCC 101016]TWT04360.1 LysM peptidoglycan-binding domain-containing protein [Planococcus sp. CPCC 101016]
MRKIIFTLFAATALSLAIGTSDTEASTYTVKPGDTLWKIASSNNVSVNQLLTWNKLSSNSIYPNQSIKVSAVSTPVASPQKTSVSKPAASSVNTYTVKAGDTLSHIARIHSTSVNSILQLNKLSGSTIHPGQKIAVSGKVQATAPATVVKAPTPAPTVSKASTYRVVSGDTLTNISKRHGMSVSQLMSLNKLTTSSIRIGQVLKVDGSSAIKQPVTVSNPTPAAPAASGKISTVISTANSLLGTPYKWGGAAPGGFDCSGFIYYVYNQAGFSVPRTNTTGLDAASFNVSSPEVGDLVFFKNTYRAGISHVGIYVGNNSFLHAGGDRVQITSLNDSYWGKHFDSYQRLNVMR